MSIETNKPSMIKLDAQNIADNYRNATEGKLSSAQIEEGIKSLSESLNTFNAKLKSTVTNRYPADGNVAALVAWARINITVKGGKSAIGDGGGVFVPGGGAFWGDIYTDDLNRLYRDSFSFQVNITPFYMNVNFFDGNSNFLGSFQGGGISVTTGTGGGKITQPWR